MTRFLAKVNASAAALAPRWKRHLAVASAVSPLADWSTVAVRCDASVTPFSAYRMRRPSDATAPAIAELAELGIVPSPTVDLAGGAVHPVAGGVVFFAGEADRTALFPLWETDRAVVVLLSDGAAVTLHLLGSWLTHRRRIDRILEAFAAAVDRLERQGTSEEVP